MRTDTNDTLGCVCILCCDSGYMCSCFQIGPCDCEICAGSLLIGSHYPPLRTRHLINTKLKVTHTNTHHCSPVCSPKQANHLHIIQEDNPVKRWMTDCWCLFSVTYGTIAWLDVIAASCFYYYAVVKHFRADSSICHVSLRMQSVQEYAYAINQWFTTVFEQTPPNIITISSSPKNTTTNTGTKPSNLLLYQDCWRHPDTYGCFNDAFLHLSILLCCIKMVSESCSSLATKMS